MVVEEVTEVDEKKLLQAKVTRSIVARIAALCIERNENRSQVVELLLLIGLNKLNQEEE